MRLDKIAWTGFLLSVVFFIVGGLAESRLLLGIALMLFTPSCIIFLLAILGLITYELPDVFKKPR